MKKTILLSFIILFSILSSNVLPLSEKLNPDMNTSNIIKPVMKNLKDDNNPNILTGNSIIETNPNDVQKIYSKSMPAVVKILVYVDYELFAPEIIEWDPTEFNNKIDQGVDANFKDIQIEYDPSSNYFEGFTRELGYNEVMRSEQNNIPYVLGTGFIIHPDGYILTNAHVAVNPEEEVKEILKNNLISQFSYDMEYALDTVPEYTSENYWYDWFLVNFLNEHLEVRNLTVRTIIVSGVENKDEGLLIHKYSPELIASEGGYSKDESDWALLKIDGKNFPTLKIGNSDGVKIGTRIIAIGYPFTSEGDSEDFSYDISPTLTTGYISQIVSAFGGKAFQVDVSLAEGNSGGPALNDQGEVIGVVTSGYLEYLGGQYNYLIRTNDIINNIQKYITPEQSKVDEYWQQALKSVWESKYDNAKVNLDYLLAEMPNHPYARHLMKEVDANLGSQEENKNETSEPGSIAQEEPQSHSDNNTIFIFFAVIILVLVIIVILQWRRK